MIVEGFESVTDIVEFAFIVAEIHKTGLGSYAETL